MPWGGAWVLHWVYNLVCHITQYLGFWYFCCCFGTFDFLNFFLLLIKKVKEGHITHHWARSGGNRQTDWLTDYLTYRLTDGWMEFLLIHPIVPSENCWVINIWSQSKQEHIVSMELMVHRMWWMVRQIVWTGGWTNPHVIGVKKKKKKNKEKKSIWRPMFCLEETVVKNEWVIDVLI